MMMGQTRGGGFRKGRGMGARTEPLACTCLPGCRGGWCPFCLSVCLCRDQQTWLNMVPAESMAVLERSIQARAACMTLPIDGSLTPQPYPI